MTNLPSSIRFSVIWYLYKGRKLRMPDAPGHGLILLAAVTQAGTLPALEQVIRRCGGQVSAASAAMGLSRKSVYEKINRHGIDLDHLRQHSEMVPPSQ